MWSNSSITFSRLSFFHWMQPNFIVLERRRAPGHRAILEVIANFLRCWFMQLVSFYPFRTMLQRQQSYLWHQFRRVRGPTGWAPKAHSNRRYLRTRSFHSLNRFLLLLINSVVLLFRTLGDAAARVRFKRVPNRNRTRIWRNCRENWIFGSSRFIQLSTKRWGTRDSKDHIRREGW